MKEHHLEVTRTARYWTLGDTTGASNDIWFVLHGYRQLAARFLRRFLPLDDGSRLIVAPEALNRFYVGTERGRHGQESLVGGTWMTREDREAEIHDYVRYLDDLAEHVLQSANRSRLGVTLLGFSQGLQTAARWAVLGRHAPDRLVLWGDYLPPDLDSRLASARLPEMDVVIVRGSTDPSRDEALAEGQRVRLEAWGVAARTLEFEGGHELDEKTLLELASQG